MERNKFLFMCREVSMLPTGICGICENVPERLQVEFEGIKYYPVTFYYRFDKGTPIDMATLHDLKANAVVNCQLSRVKPLIGAEN